MTNSTATKPRTRRGTAASREAAAEALRAENKAQLIADQKERGVKDAAAKDASVLDGVLRETTEEAPAPAAPKPARRTRKAPVKTETKPVPAKSGQKLGTGANAAVSTPVTKTGRKAPAKAAPAPAPEPTPEPASNGQSAREVTQQLARDLIDTVAARFSGYGEADQVKIANWLKVLPTGGAAHERYWPENFARPTTADWRKPE